MIKIAGEPSTTAFQTYSIGMIQSSRVKHVTIASQLWLAHIEEGCHYSKPHGRMRTSAFWSQSPTRALGNKRGMNCPTRTRFSNHHQKLHVNMPQYLVIMAWSGTTRKGEDVKIVKHANMRQTYHVLSCSAPFKWFFSFGVLKCLKMFAVFQWDPGIPNQPSHFEASSLRAAAPASRSRAIAEPIFFRRIVKGRGNPAFL